MRFIKEKNNNYRQNIAKIPDKMMCEKININRNCKRKNKFLWWIRPKMKIKNPPNSPDITAHRGVHKTDKKRNSKYSNRKIFRIRPRADTGVGFKNFHNCRDNMKNEDNSDFFWGFKFENNEKNLKNNGYKKQKIITKE